MDEEFNGFSTFGGIVEDKAPKPFTTIGGNVDDKTILSDGVIDENPKKRKNLKLILGIIGCFIILAVLAVFLINLFSVKSKYFMLWGNLYSKTEDSIKEIEKTPLASAFDFSRNFNIKSGIEFTYEVDTTDADILSWLNGFRKLKVSDVSYMDLNKDYSNSNLLIDVNDERLFNANCIIDEELLNCKLDQITDRYILADRKNLSVLWEKLGMSGPDKILSPKEIYDGMYLSKTDSKAVNNALKRSIKKISSVFSNDDFTKPVKDKITYDGKEISCERIDFTVSGEKLDQAVLAVLKQVRKEKKATEIILDKINLVGELYTEIGITTAKLTYEKLIDELDDIIQSIETYEGPYNDGIVIKTYYTGKDIVKLDIYSLDMGESIYNFVMVDNGDNRYMEYSDSYEKHFDRVTVKDGVETHNIQVDYLNFETWDFTENEYNEDLVMVIDNSADGIFKISYKNLDGSENTDFTIKDADGKKAYISFNSLTDDGYAVSKTGFNCNIEKGIKKDKTQIAAENIFDTREANTETIKAEFEKLKERAAKFGTERIEELKQLYSVISIGLYSILPYDYLYQNNDSQGETLIYNAEG